VLIKSPEQTCRGIYSHWNYTSEQHVHKQVSDTSNPVWMQVKYVIAVTVIMSEIVQLITERQADSADML